MDKLLHSDLPWQLKMLVLLTAGLVLAVAVLAVPERAIVYLGRRFPWWSPSLTTVVRTVIFWISYVVGYLYYALFVGFQGVVLGCILDVYDGRQARVYAKHGIPRTEREERYGKYIDANCDKLTVPPALMHLGYVGAASWTLAVAIMAVDVAGTVLRHFKDIGAWLANHASRHSKIGVWQKRIGEWMQAKHTTMTRDEKATSIGKIKALMQCLCLVVCMPYHQGWITDYRFVANGMCVITLFLGLLSILSRMHTHDAIDGCVDWITKTFFTHVDFRTALRSLVYGS